MNEKENKLIAEFMGLKDKDKYLSPPLEDAESVGLGMHVYPDEMRYHTSWDWLMPVLKKINLQILQDRVGMWRKVTRPIGYDVHEVHKEAVEFIKTHNDRCHQLNKQNT